MCGVVPHVCPENLTLFCNGLLHCSHCQLCWIRFGESTSPEGSCKGTENRSSLIWGKSFEPDVLFKVNTFSILDPSSPSPLLFVSCTFCDAILSLHFCSQEISHECISGCRGDTVKDWGTWESKLDRMKAVSSSLGKSNFLERISAMVLFFPAICWL